MVCENLLPRTGMRWWIYRVGACLGRCVFSRRPFLLVAPLLPLVCALAVLFQPSAVRAEGLSASILGIEPTPYGTDFIRVTWRAEIQNSTGQTKTVSVQLTLTDEKGNVVQASAVDQVTVPANASSMVIQSFPLTKAEWGRITVQLIDIHP